MRTMKRFLFVFMSVVMFTVICSHADDFAGTPEEYAEKMRKKDIEGAEVIYRRFVKKEPTLDNLRKSIASEKAKEVVYALRLIRIDKTRAPEIPDDTLVEAAEKATDGIFYSPIRWLCGEILIRRGSPDGTNLLLSVISDDKIDIDRRFYSAKTLVKHGRPEGFSAVKEAAFSKNPLRAKRAIKLLVHFLPYEGQAYGTDGEIVNIREVVGMLSKEGQEIFNTHKPHPEKTTVPEPQSTGEKNKGNEKPKIEDPQDAKAVTNILSVRFAEVIYHREDPEKKYPIILFYIWDGVNKPTTYFVKKPGDSAGGFMLSSYNKATGELVLKRGDIFLRLKQGEEIRSDGTKLPRPMPSIFEQTPQQREKKDAQIPAAVPPAPPDKSPEPVAKVQEIEKPAEEPVNSCMAVAVTAAGAIVLAGILGWLVYRHKTQHAS